MEVPVQKRTTLRLVLTAGSNKFTDRYHTSELAQTTHAETPTSIKRYIYSARSSDKEQHGEERQRHEFFVTFSLFLKPGGSMFPA
ncbi:hypothetical protein RvY_05487 [Ramazzottius varieornatus]|uniref:Uncharacterized protein n=1 Tax=Ramazzottius varieornatus TaxID=947166 RepID=A0A1D1V0S1_RAMVA|nr:hypothetical protein RvY_05487 [Ramazzottius varieornatus]